MMAPGWCLQYVGLPFGDKGRGPTYDCWGIVREVLRRERGLDLPDYTGEYASSGDRISVSAAVTEGCRSWTKVQAAQVFDVAILRLAGRPWHCGLVVADDWMLHTLSGVGSVLERLSSPVWRNRIEGFYRHE